MNVEQVFPYFVNVEPNGTHQVTFGFTPRGLQYERGPNGSPRHVPRFRVEVQQVADGFLFNWTQSPDEPSDVKSLLEDEVRRRLVARNAWLKRVADFVQQVEQWTSELGWSTRRIEKKLDDSYIGKHVVPALLMQDEVCRVLLEPVGRMSPQTEGIIDLYLLPRYDDLAIFYYDNQSWHLRYPSNDADDASSRCVTKDSLQQVLGEIKAHAV